MNKVFPSRLKELRTEKGVSQKILAKKLHISISTLSHWECGYQEPSFEDLVALCNYFEVSADYFLGISD